MALAAAHGTAFGRSLSQFIFGDIIIRVPTTPTIPTIPASFIPSPSIWDTTTDTIQDITDTGTMDTGTEDMGIGVLGTEGDLGNVVNSLRRHART